MPAWRVAAGARWRSATRRSCAPIARRAFRRCSVRTDRAPRSPSACRKEGNRVADQRRGDRRAETAMLDDRRGRVARIVERHEGHEQRVVAKLPLRGGVVAAFAGAQIVGLGGSGLPRHLDPVERQFRGGRRSVIDHAPHRLVNEVQMILVDGKLGLRRDRLVLEQARNDALSSRKAAGHHRQLQRIDEDHALADRHVDGIVSLPLAMIFAHHPVRVGDGPVALVVERQIELLAESHRADHRRQLVRADAQAHGVEIDVAAVDDRRVHIDRTMPPVAVESVVPELERPGAVHLLSAVDAGVEQRHRHRRLDRRARRIKALQRLIDQRQMVVPGQHFPLVVADPVREIGWDRTRASTASPRYRRWSRRSRRPTPTGRRSAAPHIREDRASMVSWTVPPLRSGLGSSSLTSLPRAVTSTRCPPGCPRSVCSIVCSRPSLPILTPGMRSSGFLFSFSYSAAEAAPT